MQLNKPRSKQSPLWSRCSTFHRKNFEKDISSFIRADSPIISSEIGSTEYEIIHITRIHTRTHIRTYIHTYIHTYVCSTCIHLTVRIAIHTERTACRQKKNAQRSEVFQIAVSRGPYVSVQ